MPTQEQRGKAFEYAVILKTTELINATHYSQVTTDFINGSGLENFNSLSNRDKDKMLRASESLIRELCEIEPWICDKNVSVQHVPTVRGTYDVVDVYIHVNERMLGISCKSNHDDARHSRVSPHIDVAQVWLGLETNENYMNQISSVFGNFRTYCQDNRINLYNELHAIQKDSLLYSPVTQAFEQLLIESIYDNPQALQNMVRYVVGNHDYYKAIGNFRRNILTIKAFNLRDSLCTNQVLPLPTECLQISRPIGETGLHNYVEINCNNSWAIKMRIHNASSRVENSLKWAVQLTNVPENMWCVNLPF